MKGSTRLVLQIALVLFVGLELYGVAQAADANTPIFSISSSYSLSLTPGAPTDYVHADLIAFKYPMVSPAPLTGTYSASDVWVGGVWTNYFDWQTKTGYITQNNGMLCGPDVDLTGPLGGQGTESMAGTGSEGLWYFAYDIYYDVSTGGSFTAPIPGGFVTALVPITINTNNKTTTLSTGQTFFLNGRPMLITASVPPTASAAVTNAIVPVGATVFLDGATSVVNDYGATSIVNYQWHFANTTDQSSFDVSSTTSLLQQVLTSAGDYNVTLTVTDDHGLVSTNTSEVSVIAVSASFIPSTVSVAQGAKTTTSAVIVPSDAAAQVTFLTNSTTVATVSPGSVTASPANLTINGIASGTTQLVAEVGGYTVGSLDITVLAVSHQPPTAIATTSTPAVPVSYAVTLDGSASKVNDTGAKQIVKWTWHFLDTTDSTSFDVSSDSPTLSQTLSKAGDYLVTLT